MLQNIHPFPSSVTRWPNGGGAFCCTRVPAGHQQLWLAPKRCHIILRSIYSHRNEIKLLLAMFFCPTLSSYKPSQIVANTASLSLSYICCSCCFYCPAGAQSNVIRNTVFSCLTFRKYTETNAAKAVAQNRKLHQQLQPHIPAKSVWCSCFVNCCPGFALGLVPPCQFRAASLLRSLWFSRKIQGQPAS